MNERPVRVLFTGYAPVHFLCFAPLYRRLGELPGVELFLSGGIRTKTATGYHYDGPALYALLGLHRERVLPVSELSARGFDVVFAANKRLLVPRENVGTAIQIFHGLSFRNRGVRRENLDYDRLFTIGPYMERKFVETGLLEAGDPRMVPIGFPKTDALLDRSLDRDRLLRRHGLDGSRPVLLYAPTGQKQNSLETMGEEVLESLASSGRYDVLVKLHDHPKDPSVDWAARLERLRPRGVRLLRESDVIPLLFLADLLITDASSVANEFALLDRPMVFLDVPELLRDARGAGAALDLETWGRQGGAVVRDPGDVEEAVAVGLADPRRLSAVRRAMAEDLFHNPGRATEAAVAWIRGRLLRRRGAAS